jgi:hypothetical protein
MNSEALKAAIRKELPGLLRLDPDFRSYIIEITRNEYADRVESRDWFHEILDEMRRDREKQDKKWEEQNRKWDEQNRKWDEENKKWDEQNRKWDEQWERHQRQHSEEFNKLHDEIMAIARKHDRSIGALGARWGMQSERSFRNALAGILEENFDVEVANINEYDEQGIVFGRPDQIELDIIIKNGLLLICELKSSIDKAGIHIFERKARFYENRHHRQADRLIVISPMVDPKARKLADRLGIDIYSDSDEIESLEIPSSLDNQ